MMMTSTAVMAKPHQTPSTPQNRGNINTIGIRNNAGLARDVINALTAFPSDWKMRELAFEERADLVAKLGIKILPSEDLKSRKIFCRLNLVEVNEEREQAGSAKVTFGGAKWTEQRTFKLAFNLAN
jgi:hypothetical protein